MSERQWPHTALTRKWESPMPLLEMGSKQELFYVGEGADLGLESLIVLAFDLQFRLEFLDEQVQMRNFNAQLLNVGGRGSRPHGWINGLRRAGLCLRRLPRRECFGERTGPS